MMKKVILGLAALSVLSLTSCKENAAGKIKAENIAKAATRDANSSKLPVVELDKIEHDFGTIENGTPVETVFKYKNTGNSMLVVSKINTTCGCTVPSNYIKEVPPGETGEFTVKFNGKGNGNKVTKKLTMVTNTANGNEAVKISAFVKKDPNAKTPARIAQKPSVKTTKTSKKPGHEGHNHD